MSKFVCRIATRYAILLAALCIGLATDRCNAQETESGEPPIPEMSRREAIAKVKAALKLQDSIETEKSIEAAWALIPSTLDAVVYSLSAARADIKQCLEQSEKASATGWAMPEFFKKETDSFAKTNVAVYLGRDFVRKSQLDEAIMLFSAVEPAQLVDPGTYYFHLAACQLHLQQRSEALATLAKLERVVPLPDRYRVLGSLMKRVVDPLKKDELGGIAQDMRDIRRRLDLGKADNKTVEIEKDVIARLDKLIKKLEEERQKQQQQQGDNSNQSNRPMDESRPADAKGQGKVAEKSFKKKDAWGNLPPKERDKAMQELGREFPAHYRDAIEEYFRTLAKQKDGNKP